MELIFRKPDRSMIAVAMSSTASGIEPVGNLKPLFAHPIGNPNYEMSSDASRFLFAVVPEALRDSSLEDSPLTVILNWTAILKR